MTLTAKPYPHGSFNLLYSYDCLSMVSTVLVIKLNNKSNRKLLKLLSGTNYSVYERLSNLKSDVCKTNKAIGKF